MRTTLLLLLAMAGNLLAAEILQLSPKNWPAAPSGKEADAIYGDWLLRNDKVVAVVAGALSNRNIHLSFLKGQGSLIDLTLRNATNDQLTGYIPLSAVTNKVASVKPVTARGDEVVLRVTRPATAALPLDVQHDYRLRDGEQHVTVISRVKNTAASNVVFRTGDKLRADSTFAISPAGVGALVTAFDKWFGAAYGVQAVSPESIYGDGRGSNSLGGTAIDLGKLGATVTLTGGEERTFERRVIAGRHEIEVQDAARRLGGGASAQIGVTIVSSNCVAGVDINVLSGTNLVGRAQTCAKGRAMLGLAPGSYTLAFWSLGRGEWRTNVAVTTDVELTVPLKPASLLDFNITDFASNAIPCKVQFISLSDSKQLDFGPKQRAWGCGNLYFTPNGRFSQEVPAGSYYLLISRGPEYDAVWRGAEVKSNATVAVRAALRRVVDTRGWISADFHQHSSDSGDNTTEPESRITCLAAEGVEFAACTEHNRVMSYRARLKKLGLDKLLATSDGVEMTGMPGSLNHQNAFPIRWKPNTQYGGGPEIDTNCTVQIERLAHWDHHSEKLVQQNHPDLGWLFFDKNGDGLPDEGFGCRKFMDVTEVWNGDSIAAFGMKPLVEHKHGGKTVMINNRLYNWMQLFNQPGLGVWGVANTDAHYCIHESGRIRNYVRSRTDDPARVREMDVVHEAEKGHLVISNGPFLEVTLDKAGPGDTVRLRGRKGKLLIRVQCANWLDVDHVGVFVNGRLDSRLEWTRAKNPGLFRDGVVKFEHDMPMSFARDTYLIIVAQGDNASLAPVMGPRQESPAAISNPIMVDADGDGKFTPNGDWLESGKSPVKPEWAW